MESHDPLLGVEGDTGEALEAQLRIERERQDRLLRERDAEQQQEVDYYALAKEKRESQKAAAGI